MLAALGDGVGVAVPHTPDAILIPAGGAVEELPGFAAGWFAVQDQAAQWVSLLLQPRPDERTLDACAAPGGKTAHLAALIGDRGSIIAVEKSPVRLERLQDNMARLQIASVTPLQGDVTDPALLEAESFDRILVDAPCSGTGTIRHHPEIKWRRKPSDIAAMVEKQAAILNAASRLLRPGGIMVYATCSVEVEENEEQVATFLSRNPGWQRKAISPESDKVRCDLVTPDGDFRVEPGQHDMDGFYAARLQRMK